MDYVSAVYAIRSIGSHDLQVGGRQYTVKLWL